MVNNLILLSAQIETIHGHRGEWFASRSGEIAYFVVAGSAILVWLGPKLRDWFGSQEDADGHLGLDDFNPPKKA